MLVSQVSPLQTDLNVHDGLESNRLDSQLAAARDFIYNADLDSTLNRLIHIEGWTQEEAIEGVAQYRNYLFLRKKYPKAVLPPSKSIDEVWHAHVLHTKEYREFCKVAFADRDNQFLDHHPHLAHTGSGLALEQAYRHTQRLYKAEFGSLMYQIIGKNVFEKLVDKIRAAILKRYPHFLDH